MKLLVINGPNLNMLGIREKNIYGAETYEDLKALIEKNFAEQGIEGEIYQSNHEGALVDRKRTQKEDILIFPPTM